MKKYNKPFAEIMLFGALDIMTLSDPDDNADYDDPNQVPDEWLPQNP